MCNERVQGSVEELNGHVELCLQKHGDEEENVDVEGESFEEYEWAGQRRVRASSMLLGGFAGAGLATCSSRQVDDDTDADLVVDGDDSATYGPPQYSEADVVIPSADGPREAQEREALREAVISPDGRGGTPHPDCNVEVKEEPGVRDPPDSSVVEALKSRIRDLEHDVASADKFKCLICMVSAVPGWRLGVGITLILTLCSRNATRSPSFRYAAGMFTAKSAGSTHW